MALFRKLARAIIALTWFYFCPHHKVLHCLLCFSAIVRFRHCRVLLFASPQSDQLVEAAKNGCLNDVVALLAEGANIECKSEVRRF